MAAADGIATVSSDSTLSRAAEVADLIDAVKSLIVPFIDNADRAFLERAQGGPLAATSADLPVRTALVEQLSPQDVVARLQLDLPEGDGGGRTALLDTVRRVLDLSVNTWDQGFLDKLYASNTPVGVVAELLLSVLNTNVHVFQVSPALTVIEKTTARTLATLFGFAGPHAGGITCAGGSASNFTSVVVARNTLFPETKEDGNGAGRRFALFTSQHGHYSVEKAAQAAGMGSTAVWTVAVDRDGCMIPADLEARIASAKAAGFTPLYVNATAGTTVMGSFDPLEAISAIAKAHGLWLHVDASWGGTVIFSAQQRYKLQGSHLADSLTVNAHKMMNVPVLCSFLLGPDMRIFHRANTLPAGYLFHEDESDAEVWNMADLTLQCGRRADSLKLALAWVYEGQAGFERQVDHAFAAAALLADQITQRSDLFVLVSTNPPPCLQVCFYYGKDGKVDTNDQVNTRRTSAAAQLLVRRGFLVDFAPGPHGSLFRVVVNWQTRPETVQGLVRALEIVRAEVE